ncbi:hypothetical protein EC957_006560 [Mortierella hygrophila]|uniref:PIN domain-containing protein n=1 Tax=Mortierella hygrophila TaxID=979708 RepID=A0A9P6FHW6_9FUNG|nr:hypothetical protein EC957_006560 [Mortierella hygrophila]
MSTAKTGLTVPFIPADPPSASSSALGAKANRTRKQRNNNNNNSNSNSTSGNNNSSGAPSKKLEKSPSFNSNLQNGLNTLASGAESTNINSSTNNNNNNSNNNVTDNHSGHGNNHPNPLTNNNSSPKNHSQSRNSPRNSGRSRDNSRLAADSLDRDMPGRVNNNNSSGRPSGPAGRLFDHKRDPVPVLPASSSTSSMPNGRAATGNSRNQGSNSSNRQQRQGMSQPPQLQRLYDPNQPQHSPNSQPQPQSQKLLESNYPENSSATKSSVISTAAPVTAPAPRGATAASAPSDGLVRLTKEIQQLERKLMEKPGRRTLDSDDDSESGHRKDESLGWSRRIENSKRLVYKYLKLMQLDFKSSLKHEIDTRCWKLAIYPLIETFRAALRNAEHTNNLSSAGLCLSDSDEDHSENIRHYFTEFISVAQVFYADLKTTLQQLEAKYATPNGGLARIVQVPRWHRCVGILGDLARYRWLHKLDSDGPSLPPTDWLVVARRYYREAIDLGPGNGKMYNQLALLSGCRGLESLYYYSKSLTVRSSFVNARETLMSFFSSNEQIQTLIQSKQTSKARQAALADTTRRDCEGSFLLLHSMLFEKINLDKFDKRHRTFTKQLRVLHQPRFSDTSADQQSLAVSERWDVFYFMLAVVNIAAMYEFNWTASVLAKANTAFGQLRDHLAAVATLPYSSTLLLSTMEQSMQRYLTSVGNTQRKVAVSSLEEQQGWLVYCHTVLVWMAGRPLGSGSDMLNNWLALANHETLPTFWRTLVQFMNYHWNELSPFEQSDMLSALSEEIPEQGLADRQHKASEKISFQLSLPPLGQEWELRGLAWLPTSRYSGAMFKGLQPVLDDADLNGGSFWKQEPPKSERLSKRLVELSLIAAMHMEVVEFDFCENAFKINEEYAAQAEEAGLQAGSAEDDTTDDNLLSSSHASLSQDSGLEDEPVLSSTFNDMGIFDGHTPNADILELKSKRDQLKSMLSDNRRAAGAATLKGYGSRGGLQDGGASGRRNNNKGGRGYTDRRTQNGGAAPSRALQVAENSILVIDTNCLVSDWTVIQRVVSADRWTVIIPLAVITELDGLKNNPAPLGPAAAAALDYLEGCLAMRPKPRRLKIQTSRGNYMNDLSFRVESFNYERQAPQQQLQPPQQRSNHQRHRRAVSGGGSGAVGSGGSHDERDQDDEGGSEGDYYYYDDRDEEIMRNHNVDDFILGLCLWHQENGPSSSSSSSLSPSPMTSSSAVGIYLVTYDRNLRVKARARSVQVLGKDDLSTLTSGL